MGEWPDARSSRCRAFSLVELVVVVVIIGFIAAIAVPRVSSAANSASRNALQSTIANVRRAIDHYHAEHGSYPGYTPGTEVPNDAAFVKQLVTYTDETGATNATYGYPFIYGPYLRKPFPVNQFNDLDTVKVLANEAEAEPADGSVGWVAVLFSGRFGISIADEKLSGIGMKPEDAGNAKLSMGG